MSDILEVGLQSHLSIGLDSNDNQILAFVGLKSHFR